MTVKTLFALALAVAVAVADIGAGWNGGVEEFQGTYTVESQRSAGTCEFLASPGFSTREYECERLDRH